jgi:hypothetical protein
MDDFETWVLHLHILSETSCMPIDPEMFQALYHAKLQELKFRISDYDIAKFRNRGSEFD